ncbi:MAG: hypothetical protein VCF25_20530 [Candidatus Poribacteria bacterium]
MRITAIDAHILSTQKVDGTKKYEDAAGLKFPQDTASKEVAGRTDQRHLCLSNRSIYGTSKDRSGKRTHWYWRGSCTGGTQGCPYHH